MSYAIETKKRKFERILESLTDGGASQSRTSLNSRNNNASTISLVNDTTPEGSKRRRITPTSISAASKATSTTSLTGHYLPSSRQAFLERLETFRQVTKWHIPSTEHVNASAWAKRGWTCADTDTVFCGSCRERLYVDLEVKTDDNGTAEEADDTEDYSIGKQVYEGLIKRYEELIVTAHSESCPWRKRGCDASIQRIEGLLNTNNAISSLRSRYDSMFDEPEPTPHVTELPSVQATEQELDKFEFEVSEKPARDTLRLAVCGWQRKTDDVVECQHCFRSLGLWLYRGEEPAMDRLDPVESHLEYCPWRSPDAQDTEISVSMHEEDGTVIQRKGKVSGHILVCQAIAKNNLKKRTSAVEDRGLSSAGGSSVVTTQSQTPEQREKKRLDLLRRIKDLKKPFKMKSLLKRKEKT